MYSIQSLLKGYEKKQFSPVEITQHYIEKAKQTSDLNAFISITEDVALQQAAISEKKWQLGDAGRLEGVPLSYKDNIHTKGVPSTSGSKIDHDVIPEQHADIVEAMNQSGGVMIGKTNMHEFAFGITSNNPFYGPVKNPWNKALTAGGSSGGSAAAVLAGASVASLGSDTGGSVRIPAASCGLIGLKPTQGLLPQQGITLISPSLDHPGPITRTMSDLMVMMEALTGNNYSVIDSKAEDLRGVKIGVPINVFNEKIEADVLDGYQSTLKTLEQLGAHLVDVEIPFANEAALRSFTLAASEGGYEHRNRMQQMDDYGDDVRHVMKASTTISASEYLHALKRKHDMTAACDALLEHVDAIITPTMPAQPKPIGQEIVHFNDGKEPIFDCMTRYVSYFNITGHPAISLPVGFANDIPVSVQLISGKWKERHLIRWAKVLENDCHPETL